MKAYKRKERSVLSFRSNFVVDIYSLYIYIYIELVVGDPISSGNREGKGFNFFEDKDVVSKSK